MAAWRYQLDRVFAYESKHLEGVEFANRWLSIVDGVITICPYYTWDGCSPKYYVPIFGWVGTPDGPNSSDGFPQAYWASLVHDVLCQFRTEIGITKRAVVELFEDMLLEGGFPFWKAVLYSECVNVLGPQDWAGDKLIPSGVGS